MSNPFNFNIGTSVNGNPNYNIGMQANGLFDAANHAFNQIPGASGMPTPSANAHTQNVASNQLMSTQMNNLLSQNSPYLDRARQEGMNLASRRGLANSSIAAGNAMGAAIDRAAPIAQFDAARFGSVADQNMAAQNQASLQNAQMAMQGGLANMQNQDRMNQMLLGHNLGSLDDFRRHMLGMEAREDDQHFRSGQADIDRMIQQQQFGMGYGLDRDRFSHGAGLDWANFDQNSALAWANQDLVNRQLDNQTFGNMFGSFFGALSGIYNNPNLSAAEQTAQANNLNRMFSGFAQQAWSAIPPGLISPSARQVAENLPPMTQPGFTVPVGP